MALDTTSRRTIKASRDDWGRFLEYLTDTPEVYWANQSLCDAVSEAIAPYCGVVTPGNPQISIEMSEDDAKMAAAWLHVPAA
jgi:hypothetical protein